LNIRPGITHPSAAPCAGASSKQQTKEKYKAISRQDYHLTQPCPSEVKQINKQTKKKANNSAQISPYNNFTQTTGPTLGGQKPKEERIQT